MTAPEPHSASYLPFRSPPSVEDLLAARGVQPIRSLDDLTADTFGSDEELAEFLAFTHDERQRDVA
ncbi:hypothetical protein [Plantactinospora sp. GCM10030261]|uniref:hypothetical protein n=1 Tax=Plantactinospora sp. GCM10030261 TaxID=3273420 RepID=UPI003621AF70